MNPCTPPNLSKEAVYVLPTDIAPAFPLAFLILFGYCCQVISHIMRRLARKKMH